MNDRSAEPVSMTGGPVPGIGWRPAIVGAADSGGVLVNQGEPDYPLRPGRSVTPEPQAHPTAVVVNTRMWPWTWIGPDSSVVDSDFRDYAYSVSNNQIYNAE